MGMYSNAQKSGGAAVKPIPGGSTATGSAEDEAKKESEQPGEPEEGFDGAMREHHEHMADHHEARAAHHERLSNEHGRIAEHHRKEAAYHDGKASEY